MRGRFIGSARSWGHGRRSERRPDSRVVEQRPHGDVPIDPQRRPEALDRELPLVEPAHQDRGELRVRDRGLPVHVQAVVSAHRQRRVQQLARGGEVLLAIGACCLRVEIFDGPHRHLHSGGAALAALDSLAAVAAVDSFAARRALSARDGARRGPFSVGGR